MFSIRPGALALASCLCLVAPARALTAADLKWDLSYRSALQAFPIGADEGLRSWLAQHADRPIAKRLATYVGEPVEASFLLEQPDSHAGDPQAVWIVKTHSSAQSCSFHPKLPDAPCTPLDPARAEAFMREVMALVPDLREVSDANVIDHDGPGGRARLLNYYAFVSVYVDGRALQRPVPVAELAPGPVARDAHAGQLTTAMSRLFLTPAQMNERDAALAQEARHVAAQEAAQAGDLAALAHALDGTPPLDTAELLSMAAGHGQAAAVDLLLKRGASIDAGESAALRAAVEADDIAMARHLLARGARADPPPSSLQRNTPLYESALGVAARKGNVAISRLLIEHGADVNLPQAQTVVARAARSFDLPTLDAVLAAGARPDVVTRYESVTALMTVVRNAGDSSAPTTSVEPVVRRLVAAGADVNFTTPTCKTAYGVAVDAQNGAATAALLQSLGADPRRESACRAQTAHHQATARVELDAQDRVVSPTRRALAADDHAALETLYAGLAGKDERTPSGLSKRALYFEQMRRFPARRKDAAYWAGVEGRAAAWREASPRSVPARLFQIHVREVRIAQVRGSGTWSHVAEADRVELRRLVAEAATWVQDAQPLCGDEPEWDRVMLELLPFQPDVRSPRILAEARRAIARHPGYLPVVNTAAWYLGPDWDGTKVTMEQFVREASAAAAPREGRAIYARAYWLLDDNLYHGRLFMDSAAKWPDMQAGFDDMVKAWPDPWNLNAYAYFACVAGDKATLASLLQRIGDDVVPPAWGSKGLPIYTACKESLKDVAR